MPMVVVRRAPLGCCEVADKAAAPLRRSLVPKLSSMPRIAPPVCAGAAMAPYTPVPALRRDRLTISPESVAQAPADFRRQASPSSPQSPRKRLCSSGSDVEHPAQSMRSDVHDAVSKSTAEGGTSGEDDGYDSLYDDEDYDSEGSSDREDAAPPILRRTPPSPQKVVMVGRFARATGELDSHSEASSDDDDAESDAELQVAHKAAAPLRRSLVPKLSSMPRIAPPVCAGAALAPYTPVPALRRDRLAISPESVTQAPADSRRRPKVGEPSLESIFRK